MLLERLYDADLAQAGYLIASTDAHRAVVVDPRSGHRPAGDRGDLRVMTSTTR